MAMTKRISHKKVALFGSYGWSGGAEREFGSIIEGKWELTDKLIFPGGPTKDTMEKAKEFGAAFARTIKEDRT
jgi:anaerobic nitric oxide reductase flavorubredoxin